MITASELKNGRTFLNEGKPFQVIKYSHTKIGRGGANIKVSAKNLETGAMSELSLSPTNKFDEISTQKKRMQYLYNDGEVATFMDPKTYEQSEIGMTVLGDSISFIKEGSEVDVLFWEEKALSIDIPPKVTLKVVEAAPGVKGNTASNIYKPAILENGLSVKVPLFIKEGEKVRVDTRTSEYVERVAD